MNWRGIYNVFSSIIFFSFMKTNLYNWKCGRCFIIHLIFLFKSEKLRFEFDLKISEAIGLPSADGKHFEGRISNEQHSAVGLHRSCTNEVFMLQRSNRRSVFYLTSAFRQNPSSVFEWGTSDEEFSFLCNNRIDIKALVTSGSIWRRYFP